jgi:Ca2+-binding EF-hand superfamily protein
MGANQTKLDDNVYESIAKYTQLKHDDIIAWQENFARHCDPGSTTMTKEQFCKFYQELRPNENVKSLSENIFRAFDLNGDCGISFSEVSSYLHLTFFSSSCNLLLQYHFRLS